MRKLFLFSALCVLQCVSLAQTKESAAQRRSALLAGAEFSIFNPDFYCPNSGPFNCGGGLPLIKGAGVFADYDLGTRLGAEGEARWLDFDGVGAQVESTYLIGPQFRFYRWRKIDAWAKFLVGVGAITTSGYPRPDNLTGTLFVYAPGGAIDYRLNSKFSARVDYELQKWPSFAVSPPDTNGLTPNGFSFGVAYTIFRR